MGHGKRFGFELEFQFADGEEFTVSRRGMDISSFDDALTYVADCTLGIRQRMAGEPRVTDARIMLECRDCGFEYEGRAVPSACNCANRTGYQLMPPG